MKYDINQFETACAEAREWYDTQDSFECAWNNCPRGDWMLWIASRMFRNKLSGEDFDRADRLLFRAKAECAKTVIHLMTDQRSRDAVQAAIDYSNALITREQLRHAAAADAAYAYAYAAAAYAADAAADSAYADAAAAAAADAAADSAAADAAAADARKANRKATADICRQILTYEVIKIVNS